MGNAYVRATVMVLGLLIAQSVFVSLVAIEGIVPDLLLIWVVYFAVVRGQMQATVAGFAAGLLQDVLTTQFFGLAALAKTIAGFIAGHFFNENKTELTLGTYRFMVVVALCSFVHNLVYFGIFFQGEASILARIVQVSLTTTLYTSAMSALPMFGFSRKHRTT